jgi:hypothetical protein
MGDNLNLDLDLLPLAWALNGAAIQRADQAQYNNLVNAHI